MNGTTLALLMQFCVLDSQDMYSYTIPNLNKTVLSDSRFVKLGEINADSLNFQTRGLAGLYVAGTCLTVAGISEFVGRVDPLFSQVVLAIYTLTEIEAVHSWGKYGLGPSEVNWTLARIEI